MAFEHLYGSESSEDNKSSRSSKSTSLRVPLFKERPPEFPPIEAPKVPRLKLPALEGMMPMQPPRIEHPSVSERKPTPEEDKDGGTNTEDSSDKPAPRPRLSQASPQARPDIAPQVFIPEPRRSQEMQTSDDVQEKSAPFEGPGELTPHAEASISASAEQSNEQYADHNLHGAPDSPAELFNREQDSTAEYEQELFARDSGSDAENTVSAARPQPAHNYGGSGMPRPYAQYNTPPLVGNKYPFSSHSTQPNTPPVPPAGQTGPGGGQPPLPPTNRPPGEGGAFNMGPNDPNQPPQYPGSPNAYSDASPMEGANQLANPGIAPVVERLYRNRADVPARLLGIYNFFSNRRTRNKLAQTDRRAEHAQAKTRQLEQQQQRFAQEQQRQNDSLYSLQHIRSEQTSPLNTRREQLPPIHTGSRSTGEQTAKPRGAAAEQLRTAPAQAESEELPISPLQRNERIASSAWHNIIVDEHNREVKGAMVYGHEFTQEQKELARDKVADNAAPAAQAAQNSYQNMYQPTLPSGMTSPSLPQGASAHADPQHQLTAHSSVKPSSNAPVSGAAFWVMLAIIILAFFAAALL